MLRRFRLRQHPHLFPLLRGDRLRNDPATGALGGGQAGDAHSSPEGRARVLRHQGRVRDGDIGSWVHPLAPEDLGALGPQRGLERLVRRMAILGLAPDRHGPIHAEHREHTLLQVRTLCLPLAIGHAEGHLLGRGERVIPPDTARGRITMDGAFVQAKARRRPHGPRGAKLHRAPLVEAIEDTADLIIVPGLRGSRFAQEQCRGLVGKARFEALQGAAATERVQPQCQHDGPRVHVHLRGYVVIDQADEAELVCVGRDNRQRVDGIDFDGGRSILHGILPWGARAA